MGDSRLVERQGWLRQERTPQEQQAPGAGEGGRRAFSLPPGYLQHYGIRSNDPERERDAPEVMHGGGRDAGQEAPVPPGPDVDALIAAANASSPDNAGAAKPGDAPAAPEAERPAAETISPSSNLGADSVPEIGGGVCTTIRPGAAPTTEQRSFSPDGGRERVAYSVVQPGGKPSEGSGSNDCLPSTAKAVLAWDVVADGTDWRVDCQSLTLVGQVNVKPWPNKPSSIEVPNTPNPVDGGNINNTTGSKNHWKAAIDDLADYNKPGGGAGPNWHDTEASKAHEWAHWETDYIKDSVMSAAGGNWPDVNTKLDALKVPKSKHATKEEAKKALQPLVDALLAGWRSKTISRWNAIPDSPGAAGGAGYAAGEKVLKKHIDAIEIYRKAKKWT